MQRNLQMLRLCGRPDHFERIGVTGIYPGTIQSDILARAEFSNALEKAAMQKMMDRFGIPAQEVAERTVRAIQRDRREVIIGKDAWLLVLLKRFVPGLCHLLTSRGLRRAQEKIQAGEW